MDLNRDVINLVAISMILFAINTFFIVSMKPHEYVLWYTTFILIVLFAILYAVNGIYFIARNRVKLK